MMIGFRLLCFRVDPMHRYGPGKIYTALVNEYVSGGRMGFAGKYEVILSTLV
jgi:hypothetical protein